MAQALRPFVINADDLFFLLDQVNFPTIKPHTVLSDGTVVYGYQDGNGVWHDVAYQVGAGPVYNLDATKVHYTPGTNNSAIMSIDVSGLLTTVFDPTLAVYHGPAIVRYDAPGAPTLLLNDGDLLYNGPRDFQGLRNFTGIFNNLEANHSMWGATNSDFSRLVPPDYVHYLQEAIGGTLDPDLVTNTSSDVVSNESAHVVIPTHNNLVLTTWTADVTTTTLTDTKHFGGHTTVNTDNVHSSSATTVGETFLDISGATTSYGGTTGAASTSDTTFVSGGELDTTTYVKYDAVLGKWIQALSTDSGAMLAHDFTHHGVAVTNGVSAPTVYSDPFASAVDYTPRMISETIASMTSPTLANSAMSRAIDPADTQTFTYDMLGVDANGNNYTIEANHVETTILNINSVAADPRLSGWFVLFGQFFDHGLDFIAKPGNGPTIDIALAVDDPMYGQIGPNGKPTTSITINRATPDAGTGVNGIPAQYTNHTSPYIDQSQTYGSNEQIDLLLRKWVLDPNTNTYHAGSELLDGYTLKNAYVSNTFNDHGVSVGTLLNADQAGYQDAMTTTRTLPTLAELRAALLATGRDDLSWEDVTSGYRIRDAQGHVRTDFTATGANADGSMSSGEPIILDNNPSMDAAHLNGLASTAGNFTYEQYTAGMAGALNPTGQTLSQILNASLTVKMWNNPADHTAGSHDWVLGTIDLATDTSTAASAAKGDQLHLHVNADVMGQGAPAIDFYGLAAMAPWLDFSTNSITHDIFGGVLNSLIVSPSLSANVHAAAGELMMESLSSFYVAGDGRANENFGLTTIHHVFHEDHNVQRLNLMTSAFEQAPDAATLQKWLVAVNTVAAAGATADGGLIHSVTSGATNHWEATGGVLALIQGGVHDGQLQVVDAAWIPGTGDNSYILKDADGVAISATGAFTDGSGYVNWNEDSLFNGTKLMVEMEYQHVAIDQYARLITPDLPEFVTYDATIQADISTEYAQAAFRFGHSQLRDSIEAIDPNNVVTGQIMHYALEAAFLNPQAFAAVGPGAIAAGMTHQAMNETDEFVTPALQQTLLGQPLDLAAINIARGRDLGVPTLNETRKTLYDALVAERLAGGTGTQIHSKLQLDQLKPYNSWSDFENSIMHKGSIVNFMAAYSFDGNLAKSQLIYDLSHDKALTADDLALQATTHWTQADAINFMSNNSAAIIDPTLVRETNGYNAVDLWIGGLAESHVIGGQLGYTFNAIFEDQMERLMDGDRFYYLYRLFGALPTNLNLNDSVTGQQFKDIIERTTGTQYLIGDVMNYADSLVSFYLRPDATLDAAHTTTSVLASGVLIDGADHKYGALAEALHMGIYSDGGASKALNGQVLHHITAADKYLGTDGVQFQAITGDYIYDARPTDPNTDTNGNPQYGAGAHEVLVGTAFNDYIDGGDGDDTIYGGAGNDILIGNGGGDHVYGGDGNDLIYGGGGTNGADVADFLDGGNGDDVIYGGQNNGVTEVIQGGDGNDFLYGESGIDEMHGGRGDDYVDGGNDTDVLFGDEGNDYLFGGEGPDTIYGGSGDDIIDGGSGTDVQVGGLGDDILIGSQGGGVAQGDADELIGGETNGVDNGFDLASFQVVDQALNVAADLNNQNLNGVTSGVPFLPFGEFWMGIEGIVGSKFDDQFSMTDSHIIKGATTENAHGNPFAAGIVGDDNANWLIGGSGSDRIQGQGGNDVIVGGSIKLTDLIGKYYSTWFGAGNVGDVLDTFSSYVDGASHRAAETSGLHGGLLELINHFIDPSDTTSTFAKHFEEMLKSAARQDVVLGDDASNANKGNDTAVFTGKAADYTLQAISNTGTLLGTIIGGVVTPVNGADFSTLAAVLVTDHLTSRLAADGVTTLVGDGKDVLIGVDQVQFSDQLVNLRTYFDVPATLDLSHQLVAAYAQDNFGVPGIFGTSQAYGGNNGNVNWAGGWTETGDQISGFGFLGNAATTGAIRVTGNVLQFNSYSGTPANGGADGASIERHIDLSGGTAANASVSFDFTKNGIGVGETLKLDYFNGASWTNLATYGSGTAVGHISQSLAGQTLSLNSEIRFTVTQLNANTDYFRVDNVRVDTGQLIDSSPGNNYVTTYTEPTKATPRPAVSIANVPLINDVDGTTIASAKITIRGGGVTGDRLQQLAAFSPGNLIVATGNGSGLGGMDGATMVMLAGVATFVQYQEALAKIGFSSTNDNPTNADRFVDVTVNDGFKDSLVATTTVHVSPQDDTYAFADTVITDVAVGTSFSIGDWALLANDSSGGDGGPTSIASISNGQGMAISPGPLGHSGSSSTVRSTGAGTHSFDYTMGATGTAGDHATVSVTNQSSTTLVGSADGQILIGRAGADTFNVTDAHSHILISGGGADTVAFAGLASNYSFTLNTSVNGVAATVLTVSDGTNTNILSGFNGDTVNFGGDNYTLVYGTAANLAGTAGNDIIVGGTANNTISAGAGNDLIFGGAGNDQISGGAGFDTAGYVGTYANHTIALTATGATVTGTGASASDGTDTLSSIEQLTFAGSTGAQSHVLIGTAGNDTITSQANPQLMIGGAGADTFVFNLGSLGNTAALRDVIADFAQGFDKIDLHNIDANSSIGGTQHFTFDGIDDGTDNHAQAHVGFHQTTDGHTIIDGNTGAVAGHTFQIDLIGTYTLLSTDFILV